MRYFKTYSIIAISFVVVLGCFLGWVIFGQETYDTNVISSEARPLDVNSVKPAQNNDNRLLRADNNTLYDTVYDEVVFDSLEAGKAANFSDAVNVDTETDNHFNSTESSTTPFSAEAGNSSGSSAGSESTGGGSGGGSAGSGGTASNGADENPDQAEDTSDTDSPLPPATDQNAVSSLGGGVGVIEPNYPLPNWIERDGIRAGFISSTAGDLKKIPVYVDTVKSIGLNTAIVYGCSFAETPNHLKYYREWLRLCNRAGLHVFAYYPWQPPVGNKCRPVVFSDGKEGLFPCPLDDQLWQNYLMADIAVKLTKVSMEGPQSSFDGYFLDMEMYRTENEPEAKKHYSFDTCFCDFCFSRFILDRTQIKPLPPVSKSKRKSWLSQKSLLSDYHAYLTEQVEVKAENLKNKVHAVNPKLLFGVYPALNDTNWVRNAVMRAFGRDSYPVISFSTDTFGYYSTPWGADRIPADLPAYFKKYNINAIYAAGYLFRRYTNSEIQTNIIQSYQRSQGYWLFQMSQLVEDKVPQFEALAGGTQAEYLHAVKNANAVLKPK